MEADTLRDDLGIAYAGMTHAEYAAARHAALYPRWTIDHSNISRDGVSIFALMQGTWPDTITHEEREALKLRIVALLNADDRKG